MARPELYSEELAAKVLAALSDGKSLRTITNDPELPAMVTIWRWLQRHEDFAAKYAEAKQEASDALVEDMQAIADDETIDPRSRAIRVDTRKWIASKLKPKRYGDKVQLSGDDEGAPIVLTWQNPQ